MTTTDVAVRVNCGLSAVFNQAAAKWCEHIAGMLVAKLGDDFRFTFTAYREQYECCAMLKCCNGLTSVDINFIASFRAPDFETCKVEPVFPHSGWGSIDIPTVDLVDAVHLARLIAELAGSVVQL